MKMYVKKRIGKEVITFEVEGKNPFECQMEAQKLSFEDVHKCDLCGSDDLYLNARVAQNKFKYLEIKCRHCGAAVVFGQTQEDPDTFYLRKKKDNKKELDWVPFKKDTDGQAQEGTSAPLNPPF